MKVRNDPHRFGRSLARSAGALALVTAVLLASGTLTPQAVHAAPAPARATRPPVWNAARVSWYGPGFYGRSMAGGGRLTRASMVVAHRYLPFGTRIQFAYRGQTTVAVVQDRGPYVGGREFDLGPGVARRLRFSGVGRVRFRILGR